jgi:hypothetical protein
MSTNSDDKMAGSATGALAQAAPRLVPGGYSAWSPNMDVFLQRNGAEGVHRKAMLASEWTERVRGVELWAEEAEKAALALALPSSVSTGASNTPTAVTVVTSTSSSSVAGGPAAGSGAAGGSGAVVDDDKVRAARKLVTTIVERSRKVFGIIYSALPDELRSQSAHIPVGFAYGLWHWLQSKFQSTEEDSVGALLSQWTQLHQSDEESFDAYRSRVNKVATLLEQAKEKQSVRMFAHVLLDKLRPSYAPAVLALKASGQLKDLSKVEWDTIAAFINAHELSGSSTEITIVRGWNNFRIGRGCNRTNTNPQAR